MLYKEDSLALSFPLATGKTFPVGASVIINSLGEADTPTSHENTVGFVTAIDPDSKRVTVATHFVNVVKAKASAAITIGTLVKESYAATVTNGIPTYAPATSNDYACGLALGSAGVNGDLQVGLYEVPLRKS